MFIFPNFISFSLYRKVYSPFVLIRLHIFLKCFFFKFYSRAFYVAQPFLFCSIFS